MTLIELISMLEDTSSTNDKVALIKENDSELLRDYLKYALDTSVSYFIKNLDCTFSDSEMDDVEFHKFMKDIISVVLTHKATSRSYVEEKLSTLPAGYGELMLRLFKRDIRCGVSTKIVNNAFGCEFIQDYPCMLARPDDAKNWANIKFPAIVQTKEDGGRINAHLWVGSSEVEYRSRDGKPVHLNNKELDEALLSFLDYLTDIYGLYKAELVVLDGEILFKDPLTNIVDRSTSNGLFTKAIRGTISHSEASRATIVLWDYILSPEWHRKAGNIEYWDKAIKFHEYFTKTQSSSISFVDTAIAENMEDVVRICSAHYKMGLEGVIVKNKGMMWEPKRSKNQVKMKEWKDFDGEVIEWLPGTGKYVGKLGALKLKSSCGGLTVEVGSGFTDAERQEITPDIVGSIVQIKYNAMTMDKKTKQPSLFLPIFQTIRLDKSSANSLLEISK